MYVDSLCPRRCQNQESEYKVDGVVSSLLAGTVRFSSCAPGRGRRLTLGWAGQVTRRKECGVVRKRRGSKWGCRKGYPDSPEHRADPAPGEPPNHTRGFLGLSPVLFQKSRNLRGRPGWRGQQLSRVPAPSPEAMTPKYSRVAWRGRPFLASSPSERKQKNRNQNLPAKPSPGRPHSARVGRWRPPRAHFSSAMASCFCFGFCRAGSSRSPRHGPPEGRGAGWGLARVQGWPERRAEGPAAGGEAPPRRSSGPRPSPCLCALQGGRCARWNSQQAGERGARPPPTRCPVVRDAAVWSRGRFAGCVSA